MSRRPGIGVLIETYWNVKFNCADVHFKMPDCINRNILECKVVFRPTGGFGITVLIETYWNVKEYTLHHVNL